MGMSGYALAVWCLEGCENLALSKLITEGLRSAPVHRKRTPVA